MRPEIVAVTLIILLLAWASIWLLRPVYAREAPVPRQPTYQAPDIAQCDKELWERIRNGC